MQVIHQTFSDINHFEESHRQWHWKTLESMQQLATGPFQGAMTVLTLEGINIYRFFWSCLVEVVATKAVDSFIFGITLQVKGHPPLADKIPISNNNCMFGFSNEPEANLITATEGLEIVLVVVKKSLFYDFVHQMKRYDLDETFMAKNVVILEQTKLIPYRKYLQELIYLCVHQPQSLQTPVMQQIIPNDLIPLLINTLQDAKKLNKVLPIRRAKMVEQSEEFIQSNLDRPITLKDMYSAVHFSRRSLIYGFEEVFGMGPMAYLKLQRLNGVRRALLMADPKKAKVSSIANNWGFCHLGRFAHDYKKLFGETPLKTLKSCL